MTSRKLQAEIDRTLKKLKEGQDNFDAILSKWESAWNSNKIQQREKMEIELKREIKRLQRHRETVKQWISNVNIKDKSKLLIMKRSVEDRMECFKKCERRTKTKEYSIDSLAAQKLAKQQEIEHKMKQPQLDEDQETAIEWIEDICQEINNQLTEFQVQFDKYEDVLQNFSKNRNKKKMRNNNERNLEMLRTKIERHRWHVCKLQMCKRKILERKVMANLYEQTIKDTVEYYVNESMDDDNDFYCDSLFEDFEKAVEVIDIYRKKRKNSLMITDDDRGDGKHKKKNFSPKKYKSKSKQKQKQKKKIKIRSIVSNATVIQNIKNQKKKDKKEKRSAASSVHSSCDSHSSHAIQQSPISQQLLHHCQQMDEQKTVNHNGYHHMSNHFESKSNIQSFSASVLEKQRNAKMNVKPSKPPQQTQTQAEMQPILNEMIANATKLKNERKPPKPRTKPLTMNKTPMNTHSKVDQLLNEFIGNDTNITFTNILNEYQSPKSTLELSIHKELSPESNFLMEALINQPLIHNDKSQFLPPFTRTLSSTEHSILQTLEDGYHTLPQMKDAHEPSYTQTSNPMTTPPYLPKYPYLMFEQQSIFREVVPDVLFFMFYYQPGTYQQLSAARQLKIRGWRYHSKYHAWFQRARPMPSSVLMKDAKEGEIISLRGKGYHFICEDRYERGCYLFFDGYSSAWAIRIKSKFKFEYCWLEDDLHAKVDRYIEWKKLSAYGNGCGFVGCEDAHKNWSKKMQRRIPVQSSSSAHTSPIKQRMSVNKSRTNSHHRQTRSNVRQRRQVSSVNQTMHRQIRPRNSEKRMSTLVTKSVGGQQKRFRPPIHHNRQNEENDWQYMLSNKNGMSAVKYNGDVQHSR